MANGIEEEAFEMKCMFEMKREDPMRKDWECKRMSVTEFGKKGCKNQSSPESRNESNRAQMAVICKKVNECDCVNDEKRNVLLDVNENRDRTLMNEMAVITVKVGSGLAKKEMTAQFVSGIENNTMTAKIGGGIVKKEMTAQFGSGIGITAKFGSSIVNNRVTA